MFHIIMAIKYAFEYRLQLGGKNNVIAHIAGPSGSGKSTLGEIISNKFTNILVKDLDDFNDTIQHSNRFLNMDNDAKGQYYKVKFEKLMQKYIHKHKNQEIIFVGYNENWNNWIDIPADNLFFIDIPISKTIRQRYARNSKEADVSVTDIIDWIKVTEEDILNYRNHDYKFLSPEKILVTLSKIIQNC